MNVGNRFGAVSCVRKEEEGVKRRVCPLVARGLSPCCQLAVLAQHKLADDEQHNEEHSVHDAEEAEEGRRVRRIRLAQARDTIVRAMAK